MSPIITLATLILAAICIPIGVGSFFETILGKHQCVEAEHKPGESSPVGNAVPVLCVAGIAYVIIASIRKAPR